MTLATFHPQKYVGGHIVDTEPDGNATWRISPGFETKPLKGDPVAPGWIRGWQGPYWIEVR